MADQLAPRVLGCHGGMARTPTIDALAARGVIFDDARCNSPLCTPSRTAMMTGLLPSRSGAFDNAADFPASLPTFAHRLRARGYRTVLSGKMHFIGPDQLHGFEERLTTDIYPAALGWTPDWTRPDLRPEWYHTMDSVTQAGPCVRTNQLDFDEEAVFAARRHLFDIARGSDDRPFCMTISLSHPHDPFTIPEPWWGRHADSEIPVARAPSLPADDPHAARLAHVIGLDGQAPTEAQVHAARRAYLGAVSYVDDQFAAVLATLREARLDDGTVVIVTSDHGEFLGERGLWFKMSHRLEASRVPLIISAPNHFSPRRVSAAVSLVDLLPTLRELADDAPDDTQADGRSLIGHCSGTGGRDEVLGEYLAEGAVAPMVLIRRGGRSFIHSPGDPDQLLEGDEDANLAPREPERVAMLRAEVARRWDLPGLHAAVLASQRRRTVVAAALRRGARTSWDWQPPRDAGREYVHEHLELNEIEARDRFPPVEP